MSKHAIIGIIVLCFVSTFMTMLYQYASRSYLSESNPPISGGPNGGHHAAASHVGAPGAPAHESATPQPAMESPGSAPMETPATPTP